MGRFTDDFRFGWTAGNVRLRFRGTAANVVVELTRGRESALQVVVDGEPTHVLFVTKDQTVYPLASGLPEGEHTVEIWKRPEGFLGELKWVGFQLDAGALTRPSARPARRLMVIGDSISCGYGNEAAEIREGNTVANENGYMAYGPLAARRLDAELAMICWSGRGLFRNRNVGDDRTGVLPELFDQTLPLDPALKWDHASFVPHVIVINLGTNDIARGPENEKPELTKEEFLGAYRAFIERLHRLYPEARIMASIGPMLREPISGWLPELERAYPFVNALVFEGRQGKEYFGGHWHPSVAMHQIMADTLVEKLREVMGDGW
jgi:lysophospholipase L1-like esterase